MYQKRGELTSATLIPIIILVIGFIILLFFLVTVLDLGFQSKQEVCKLSVLTRATVSESGQSLIPLKCETQKFCLNTRGDTCPQFEGFSDIESIKLPSKAESAARKIEEISALAMYDCWNMMGQGKLDLFSGSDKSFINNVIVGQFITDEIKPTCVICSRLALAPDLINSPSILNQVNINRYMEENLVPGTKLTFLQTFTDRQISSFPQEFTNQLGDASQQQKTDQMAFIFMQILAEESAIDVAKEKGVSTGVLIFGGLFFSPFGKITQVSPLSIGVKSIATVLGAGIAGGISYLQATENQGIAATHCGPFTSGSQKRQGCSVVTPIDYNNKEKINSLCARIESQQ